MKYLVLSFLFVCSTASAAWDSTYEGSVTYTNDLGDNSPELINIVFTSDATTFSYDETFVDLGYNFTKTFDITNGDLYLEGQKVGTITDNLVEIKYQNDYENIACYQTYKFEVNGAAVKMTDLFDCDDGYYDHYEGELAGK